MTALTATTLQGKGSRAAVENTLTASDTFTVEQGKKCLMILFNPSGGSIVANFDSDLPNFDLPEVAFSVNASTGMAITVAAGDWRIVNLEESYLFLNGQCTITGGTGLRCWILKE